jgi:hypothetical protein
MDGEMGAGGKAMYQTIQQVAGIRRYGGGITRLLRVMKSVASEEWVSIIIGLLIPQSSPLILLQPPPQRLLTPQPLAVI